MCGRLVLTSSYKEKIKAIFDHVEAEQWLPPRYNITPGQPIPVMNQEKENHIQWSIWGHTQSSSSSDRKSRLHINARAETIHRLPTFKDAFTTSRCVIFADGFYEWHRAGKGKPQPHFFEMKNHAILPIAGLLLSSEGTSEQHSVVITTEANSLMHPIHHRMPVIFSPLSARTWLQKESSPETLQTLLQPYLSNAMTSHPVSAAVNKASTEGPELIERVQIVEQTDLF